MTSQELKDRIKKIAKDCIQFLKEEVEGRLFWHTERQLISSTTPVAANYRAACLAQSTASFVAKTSIVIERQMNLILAGVIWTKNFTFRTPC